MGVIFTIIAKSAETVKFRRYMRTIKRNLTIYLKWINRIMHYRQNGQYRTEKILFREGGCFV